MILPVGITRPFCLRLKIDQVLVSNGAVFMPNITFTMQEWTRTSFDEYSDSLEEETLLDTTVLSVGKGIQPLNYDVKTFI